MILAHLKRRLLLLLLAFAFLAGLIGMGGWYTLLRQPPPTTYATAVEQFKYGSIGTEKAAGLPYWIWVVLPRLFPEKLPGSGGYTSLGLTWEQGKEMPVGLTKETVGIARVGVNCALCHVGTLRESPKGVPQFLLGAPSTTFDPYAYLRFFFDCAKDPRFTANVLLPEIRYNHSLSFPERWFYRYIIIPRTRASLLHQAESYQWLDQKPLTGPGRTDMNPLKINLLGLPEDGSIGSTDIMAIWNENAPANRAYHADGISSSLQDVTVLSALGAGATRSALPTERLKALTAWLQDLPPPAYPFAIDAPLAAKGATVFANTCASCHASSPTSRVGQVIPLAEIQTDPHRQQQWTAAASQAVNDFGNGKAWDINSYRPSDGYIAPPLAGLWARAPYLHNGSVPTLAALLQPPGDRPREFYRGVDVYDPANVGFLWQGAAAEKAGFLYQIDQPGNSSEGHTFGTTLPEPDKRALIEYLKTL